MTLKIKPITFLFCFISSTQTSITFFSDKHQLKNEILITCNSLKTYIQQIKGTILNLPETMTKSESIWWKLMRASYSDQEVNTCDL